MTPGRGMWRHAVSSAVRPESIITLGEGDTPLLDLSATLGAAIGVGGLFLKAEDRNPTGSFKARIASVAASLARQRGLHGLVGTSSGNGGAAAAAYAAAAGVRAVLFTLSDTLPAKLLEITAAGGVAFRVDGVGHDAASTRRVADLVAAAADAAGYYPMLTGFHYAPEAMVGVQTIADELGEDVDDLTAVYAPVGGGGLLTGLYRGFSAGSGPMPHLVGVHPAGASALPLALDGHAEGMSGPVASSVSGLQMAVLYDVDGAVKAIRGSDGWTRAVTDESIWNAQRLLAREHGVLVEPAGATALAGLLDDAAHGLVGPDDRVVVILSGAGYKDRTALERLSDRVVVPVIAAAEVGATLARVLAGTS